MRRMVIGIGTAATLVGSCGRPSDSGAEDARRERAAQLGAAAADELVATLMPELQAAMQAGGAEAAIRVCSERAQELTGGVEAAYASDGLRIRRTALRVRNAANAPDGWEREWLEHAAASPEAPTPTTIFATDERGREEVRYLRPLMLNELCLACHGPVERIDPAVRAVLAERYPADQATGFEVGDLRGVISVRVPVR